MKIDEAIRVEFTKLKQKWQQSKATTYLAKEGEEILPGFKGQYHA